MSRFVSATSGVYFALARFLCSCLFHVFALSYCTYFSLYLIFSYFLPSSGTLLFIICTPRPSTSLTPSNKSIFKNQVVSLLIRNSSCDVRLKIHDFIHNDFPTDTFTYPDEFSALPETLSLISFLILSSHVRISFSRALFRLLFTPAFLYIYLALPWLDNPIDRGSITGSRNRSFCSPKRSDQFWNRRSLQFMRCQGILRSGKVA